MSSLVVAENISARAAIKRGRKRAKSVLNGKFVSANELKFVYEIFLLELRLSFNYISFRTTSCSHNSQFTIAASLVVKFDATPMAAALNDNESRCCACMKPMLRLRRRVEADDGSVDRFELFAAVIARNRRQITTRCRHFVPENFRER